MTSPPTFVIVGAGLAGAKAAETLRDKGFGGRIVLFGDESERPYDRPPLSKDYLLGKSEKEKIYVHPLGWEGEHDVELRLGTRVTAINRNGHEVSTRNGERLGYDKLLLSTGSSPRRLSVPGNDLDGVHYLRRVDDCEALKSAFAMRGQIVIIGAGWIGLEAAAAARAANCHVTVIGRSELPLLGVLGREVAEIYADLHRDHGVEFQLGTGITEIIGNAGRAVGVRLLDGHSIDADVVVVGVGITPNTDLAEAAELVVDNGVVVDEHLTTSDRDVFAAGDVANVYYPDLGRHLRLEHWSAALNQGPVAAANMMGQNVSYDHMPYFFSDQYDMGMEYSGNVEKNHYDEVIFRGNVGKGEFVAFWMEGSKVLAGMNVNIWDTTDAIAALVRSKVDVDVIRLADATVPLGNVRASTPTRGAAL